MERQTDRHAHTTLLKRQIYIKENKQTDTSIITSSWRCDQFF